MARVNVYLPDELAARAREKGLNMSALARVEHDDALTALDATRDELSGLGRG